MAQPQQAAATFWHHQVHYHMQLYIFVVSDVLVFASGSVLPNSRTGCTATTSGHECVSFDEESIDFLSVSGEHWKHSPDQ